MMKRSARVVVALSLAPALVLGTAAGANAASKVVKDPTGDTYEASLKGNDVPVRQASPIADIVAVKTTYRKDSVVVLIRARGMGRSLNAAGIEVKTSNPGRPYLLSVRKRAGHKPRADLFHGLAETVSSSSGASATVTIHDDGTSTVTYTNTSAHSSTNEVSCPGLRATVRPAGKTIRAEIPSSCLGSPTWVRTGAAMDSDTGDGSHASMDLAGADVIPADWWLLVAPPLPLGPKVRRG